MNSTKKKVSTNGAKCLWPDCHKAAHIRGLCKCCYSAVNKMVRDKKISWPTLERLGKVLKPSKVFANERAAWFLNGKKNPAGLRKQQKAIGKK